MKAWLVLLVFCALILPTFAADAPLNGEFKVLRVTKDGVFVTGNLQVAPGDVYVGIHPFVLVTGIDGKAEGDRFDADVLADGLYTFIDTAGESRTVHRYKLVKLE